uniref:uncharacterized protein LOC124066885 isoform X2 n=1 Tax=Scatophagus argus TaxID=75038 RepID=UPI001ED7EC02|nr:uncharacterized protein LOC124066885 isoform X2 [Scatophagus argus]
MSADDFQTKYASVMDSMLKSAIAETTKLFESMVDELKAEISRIKKENEDLKARCSLYESARIQPTVYVTEREPLVGRSGGSEKRDTAVQCDPDAFDTILVEQCQPLRHSLSQNQKHHSYEEMVYALQEHDYEICGEGNSQMAFTLVKQEQEEAESTVGCGQVSSDKADPPRTSPCRTEHEGPFIDTVCSTREIPLPQGHEDTQVALELPSFGTYSCLQGAQNQSSELGHTVISLAAIKDGMQDEPEVSQKTSDIHTHGELMTSHKHQLLNYHQSEAALLEEGQLCQTMGQPSINDPSDVAHQQHADMQSVQEQLAQHTPLNEGEICDELKNSVAEVEASSQPDGRGQPPKKAKHLQRSWKDILQSPSPDITPEQEVKKSPAQEVKEVEVSSAVDTVNITSLKSLSQARSVHPEDSSSVIIPSNQERTNPALKDVVVSLEVSSVSQQHMNMAEGIIQAPSAEVSSTLETPTESPQIPSVQPRECCTSVNFQDAMLLVEAMYQPVLESTFSFEQRTAAPQAQTHCALSVGALQSVGKAPAEIETVLHPVETHEALDALPTELCTTTQSIMQKLPPQTTDVTLSSDAQAHIKILTPKKHHMVTLSNAMTSSKRAKAVPSKLIVPRSVSSLMPHKIAVQSPTQLPNVRSMCVAAQNKSTLPGSTAVGLPFGTLSFSSASQKTDNITASKSHPVVTQSTITSKDLESETLLRPKIITMIPQTSVGPEPTFMSPVVAPVFKPQLSAVVRLTRLPFPVSTNESVLVSRLCTNGCCDSQSILKECTIQEKSSTPLETLVSSNDICSSFKENSVAVSAKTSQMSEDPNDIKAKVSLASENCTTLEELPDSRYVQLSAPSAYLNSTVTLNMTESSAVSGGTGELASNLDREIISSSLHEAFPNDQPVEEMQSAAIINVGSITSKDTSEPHLQMSKTTLAQLAMSPAAQDPQKASSNESVDARASCTEASTGDKQRLQKNFLMVQLRHHIKSHLQAKKNETNPEPRTETETGTVSLKNVRLENDHPNDKNTTSVHMPLNPENPWAVEDVTSPKKTAGDPISISYRRSGLCKDVESKNASSALFSVSSKRSKASNESTPIRPRRTNSFRDGVGSKNKKSTFVSPERSSPTEDGGTPQKPKNISVLSGKTSSTSDDAVLKKRKIPTNNTKTTPVRSKRTCLSRAVVSPKRTESTSVSSETSGTSKSCTAPEIHTSDLTSVIHIIKEGTIPKINLKLVDFNKVESEATKVTTIAKMRDSHQSTLQNGAKTSQLVEIRASCEAVKKCMANAVWTPPKMPPSKTPPAGEKRSVRLPVKKETISPRSQNRIAVYPPSISLHPIPVKTPPVVSPLQPLSVIGRRLLKNQCGECGRVLSSSAALESHVRLHKGRRPFSCTLCGKCFTDSKGLKRHGRVHRNGRIHVCQQCGKGFVYRFGLTKHVQMVHSRIKPFVCQICNKGCFTKLDVEAHIRIHTGEKPFHCNLCEKKFTRRVDLNVHLRWHNGEKRHWCPYCGKGFLDFNNMKRHKYIHTGEKPHSCPHCPKHFTQSGHLKKHVKNVHKIQ